MSEPKEYGDLVQEYDDLTHAALPRDAETAKVYASLANAWATMELAEAVREGHEPAKPKPTPSKDRPRCGECLHSFTQHYNEGPCRVTRCECKDWQPEDIAT